VPPSDLKTGRSLEREAFLGRFLGHVRVLGEEEDHIEHVERTAFTAGRSRTIEEARFSRSTRGLWSSRRSAGSSGTSPPGTSAGISKSRFKRRSGSRIGKGNS
jgi:hypothetical protein